MADEISKYKKQELIYKSRVLELAYEDKTDSLETDLNQMYDTAEEIKQALEHSDFEKMRDLIDAHFELIENIECGIIKESKEPRPIKGNPDGDVFPENVEASFAGARERSEDDEQCNNV